MMTLGVVKASRDERLTGVRLVMIGHDATVVNDCLLTDILIYNNI